MAVILADSGVFIKKTPFLLPQTTPPVQWRNEELLADRIGPVGNRLSRFQKQTMTYRHYPKADTLVIWQQFEGIYGRSRGDQLFGEEKGQLKTVLAGRRTFFSAIG